MKKKHLIPPPPPWGPGGDIWRWGHIRILYKASIDYAKHQKGYTKLQKIIQSPKRPYKAPTDYTKSSKKYTKT